VFNANSAELAVDNDKMTCAATGWGTTGQWWKIDLGSRQTVTAVHLTGEH